MGKTMIKRWGLCRIRKHPHAHGEDTQIQLIILVTEETPPRAWGRPLFRVADLNALETPPRAWGRHPERTARPVCRGNTPTRMGKTPPGLSDIEPR